MIHCHKNNIIYRNLKPENIEFDIRDDIKIVDLTLAIVDLYLAKQMHEEERLPNGTYQLRKRR